MTIPIPTPAQLALVELFPLSEWNRDGAGFEVSGTPDDFTIKWGDMYAAPTINAELLMRLVEFFGTKSIDVDGYAEGGCETCDWGSEYGHEIRVRGATRGYEDAKGRFSAQEAR